MEVDISTTYLGLRLDSPLVASASPCTGQIDVLQRLEQSGAGAAVLPSLFEEQIVHDSGSTDRSGIDTSKESLESAGSFPYLMDYNTGSDSYLKLVERAKQAVTIPIIASLNGVSAQGWVAHARRIEDAGADALELNIYHVPTDIDLPGATVEAKYLEVVEAVRGQIDIPLAVKIGPFFSSLPNMASRLVEAGADGLVLFNRYLEPDIDLEELRVEPHLELSRSSELRLSLRWLGILRPQLKCSLAASSGVHSGLGALKALAAGADCVMVTSVLLKRGAEHLQALQSEMLRWLDNHECASLHQLKGSFSRQACATPAAFERANYAAALTSYMDRGPSRPE